MSGFIHRVLNVIYSLFKVLFYISVLVPIAIGMYVFVRCEYYKWNTEKVYEKNRLSVYLDYDYPKSDTACLSMVLDKSLTLLRKKGICCSNVSLVFYYHMTEYDSKVKYFKTENKHIEDSKACTYTIGRTSLFSAVRFCEDTMDGEEWIPKSHFNSVKPASSTIAHEICHIYEYDKLGVIKYYDCSMEEEWKIEGFADYVAEKSSIDEKKGIDVFMGKEECRFIGGYFYQTYFLGRLRTDYLLRHKGIPEDEYWDTKYDTDKLDDEIRTTLRSGEYRMFEK